MPANNMRTHKCYTILSLVPLDVKVLCSLIMFGVCNAMVPWAGITSFVVIGVLFLGGNGLQTHIFTNSYTLVDVSNA